MTRLSGLVAALVLFGGSALAGETEEGWGFSATDRSTVGADELPGAGTLLTRRSTGVFFTRDPEQSFNGSSYECVGTFHVPADDPQGSGFGQCHGVDLAGDIWWLQYRGQQDHGTWSFLDGTGRYRGIEGGGTWDARTTAGPPKYVTSWKGEWRLADE